MLREPRRGQGTPFAIRRLRASEREPQRERYITNTQNTNTQNNIANNNDNNTNNKHTTTNINNTTNNNIQYDITLYIIRLYYIIRYGPGEAKELGVSNILGSMLICLNWLSGALVGVGGSGLIAYLCFLDE